MRFTAIYKAFLLTACIVAMQPVMAQKDMLAKADKYYANGVYPDAAAIYLDKLEQQYDYLVNTKLADCYYQMDQWREAEHWYGVIVSHNIADAGTLLRYANLLKINGKYKSAKEVYLKYAAYKKDGYYLASTCDWALANQNKPSGYSVELLSLNSSTSEITPTVFKKGLIYAKSNGSKENPNNGIPYYDLFYAEPRVDGSWQINELEHINSDFHDAAPFYDSFNKLLFFTRNNHFRSRTVVSLDGQVKLEMFYAPLVDSKFTHARPVTLNSNSYSVAHPTVSPDGNILIFVSDMRDGKGGTDLYYSVRRGEVWSDPINMGDVINTPGDEMYPFLSADGTLYFSSNYHTGFGGYDIFKSVREMDHWSTPENLGAPVNSPQDDFGFTMLNGFGYFSSNRPGGKGGDDIYQVTQLAPISTVYVYDTDQKPLYKAKVTFFESPNMQIICETDVNGLGDISNLSGASTAIRVTNEGYLDKVIMDVGSLRSSNGILPVELQPLLGTNE